MVLPIIAHTEHHGRLASAGQLDDSSLSVLEQQSLEASFGGSFSDADFVNVSEHINRAGVGMPGAHDVAPRGGGYTQAHAGSLEGTGDFGPDICDDDTMSVHSVASIMGGDVERRRQHIHSTGGDMVQAGDSFGYGVPRNPHEQQRQTQLEVEEMEMQQGIGSTHIGEKVFQSIYDDGAHGDILRSQTSSSMVLASSDDGNGGDSAPDPGLDTRSFTKEARTMMLGALGVEKTLITQFGVKTSVSSREDHSLAAQALSKLTVGEGFYRASNFEKVNNEDMLRMNAWNAFQKYSVDQGDLVMDGGSRGIPVAVLVTALGKVCAQSITEKNLASIVARQQYPSKAMLSWKDFLGLCLEIYYLNQGNFFKQGQHGGTKVRPERLSRKGSSEVQRKSRMSLSTPAQAHQPLVRHRPTEAENVLHSHCADRLVHDIHDYHLENMGFQGGVFDEPTTSIGSYEAFEKMERTQKHAHQAQERASRRRDAALRDYGQEGSGSLQQSQSQGSLGAAAKAKMSQSTSQVTSGSTGGASSKGLGNSSSKSKVLIPKMKMTAFDLLMQKQRGASSIKMSMLPPGASNAIGTSHEFVDIEVGGTAGNALGGAGDVKIPTKKISDLMLSKFHVENQLKRQQVAEMHTLYPIKDVDMQKADIINRLAQPLIKQKVYTMTHRNESQVAKWKRMKKLRSEREAREEKKEKRKSALSFISSVVQNGEKAAAKKTLRDLSMIKSFEKKEFVEKCKDAESEVQLNIEARKEDIQAEKKGTALNMKMALNSSIELTQSILEDEMVARKDCVRTREGPFKLNPSSSALLKVPEVLKEKIRTARTLEQYNQAVADEKNFKEETMSSRIRGFATAKFEKMGKVAENTTKIPYGGAVDVDRQASMFHNDHLIDPNSGAYLYDGFAEGNNSNHANRHKPGGGGHSAQLPEPEGSYQSEMQGLQGLETVSDFAHALTPNYSKYGAADAGFSPLPSAQGQRISSSSEHMRPLSSGGPGGLTAQPPKSRQSESPGHGRPGSSGIGTGGAPGSGSGENEEKRVLISRTDGRDLASPGKQSVPTSTTDIRKMPFKDKSDHYVSPHGKNVYPAPREIQATMLNSTVDLREAPPGSPPNFRLSTEFTVSMNSPGSPGSHNSNGSDGSAVMRDLAINEYISHVSKIEESPRLYKADASPSPIHGSPIVGSSLADADSAVGFGMVPMGYLDATASIEAETNTKDNAASKTLGALTMTDGSAGFELEGSENVQNPAAAAAVDDAALAAAGTSAAIAAGQAAAAAANGGMQDVAIDMSSLAPSLDISLESPRY